MKQKIYIFTLAAALLTGCASDEFTGRRVSPDGEVAISFNGGANGMTRADATGGDAATLLGNNFVVEGVKGDGNDYAKAQVVFDHYNVNWTSNTAGSTESNSSNWEYVGQTVPTNPAPVNAKVQTIKYWDFGADQYDFVAMSKGLGNAVFSKIDYANIGNDTKDEPVYTVTGSVSDIMKAYVSNLLTIEKANYGMAPVTPKFRSLSSKIRLAIYETIPGYSVKDVVFYVSGSEYSETQTNAILYTTGTDKLVSGTASGKMKVYYPNPDGKKPLVTFEVAEGTGNTTTKLEFGKPLTYTGAESEEAEDNVYLGRSSNEASFVGKKSDGTDYITVMPTGEQKPLTLRVKYTLVSLDGRGETIPVGPMSAVIPAEFTEWQPNFAYTYLFKITDEGSGLYPISFDAVDMIDYAPQESDTENSKPNITTYQNGVNVSDNDEYLSGKNIYVTVGDLMALDATKVRLFTATVEEGAVQGIDELSVANCFNHGTYDATAKTYTVTDINGKKLVLTDVTATKFDIVSTIPSEDWKDGQTLTRTSAFGRIKSPDPNTVYVFQYLGGGGLQLAEYNTLPTGAKYYEWSSLRHDWGGVADADADGYYLWNIGEANGTELYKDYKDKYIKDLNLGKAYDYPTSTDPLYQPINPTLTAEDPLVFTKSGNVFFPYTPVIGNEPWEADKYYKPEYSGVPYNYDDVIVKDAYYYTKDGLNFIEHIADEDFTVKTTNTFYYFSFSNYGDGKKLENQKESYFHVIRKEDCKSITYDITYIFAYEDDGKMMIDFAWGDGKLDATDNGYYDLYACPNSNPSDYHPIFYQESDFNTLKNGEVYEDESGTEFIAEGTETLATKKAYVKGSVSSNAYKVIKVK